MEGDAGAGRLNPADAEVSSSWEMESEDSAESEIGIDPTSSVVKSEDSAESEIGIDPTSSVVKSEDSSDSEVGTDQTSSKVKSEDSSESEVGTEQPGSEESAEVTQTTAEDGERSADVVPEPADEAVPASAVDEGARLG